MDQKQKGDGQHLKIFKDQLVHQAVMEEMVLMEKLFHQPM
jgi:hypothetical protein